MRITYSKLIPSSGVAFRTLLCCAVLILIACLGARAQTSMPAKSVLVLYDEHTGLPGLSTIDNSIRSTLGKADPAIKIAVYSESMDLSRFQQTGYDEVLRDYYKQKYRDKKIDVVIAVLGALNFALAHVDEIAPGAPIVFCGTDPRAIGGRDLGQNVTGVLVQRDFKETLEIALKLQPNTRQVVFIGGTGDFDKYLVTLAAEQLKEFENRVKITYLTDLPLDEILRRVANLPPDTIVLFSTFFKDGAGESFVPHDVITQVSEAANVPVYGFLDQYIGRGIVGGHLYSVEAHGSQTAEIALKILRGESAANIPIVEVGVNVDMFDGRQLKRWGISKNELPVGSVVLFDEPTLWEAYKWYVVGTTAAIIVEALLIAGLILLRVRGRKAEEQARQAEEKDKAILTALPDLMFFQTPDGEFLDYHATDPNNLFVSPDAFLGKNVRDVLPPDLAERLLGCFEKTEEGGPPQILEYSLAVSGEEGWYEARMVRIGGKIITIVRDITERKRAEAELGFQSRMLNTVEQAAIAIYLNGIIFYWNRFAEELYGWSADEAIGREVRELLVTENIREQVAEVWSRLESGQNWAGEFPVKRRDGTIVQVWVNDSPIYNDKGELIGILSITHDITERKIAERAVQESERRLLRAQQAARVGTWEWDIGSGRSVWSEMIWELLGLEPGDGESSVERFTAFIHPDDRERVLLGISKVLADGDDFSEEFRLLRRDGTILWVTSKGAVIRSEDGQPERMLGVNIDITERKLTEEKVRESEDRFRNMADNAPMMVWVSGVDKLTTYFNKEWLDFSGRTMEQELGNGWAEGVHPDDLAHCLEVYHTRFDQRERFEMEYRLRRFDGEYRWVVDRGTPRFTTQGEFRGYIGTAIDITDRKESERELLAAHDELKELKNQLEAENIYLQEELRQDQAFGDIVGQSSAISYVLYKVSQVAPIDSTVLVMGETGTGKELVARAIHEASKRNDRPLIKVNCAALAPSLVESELFGHEKGAFSGAGARKLGRFELANTGTLLLDEIGDLPLDLQSKLLRVIQEGEFERVGSGTTIKTDVRIIALTNRDLKHEVEQGRFREDLWYRLNVFPITTPPLRDRPDDIPILTEHFARTLGRKFGKEVTAVSPDTMKALCAYSWPGNVRELANVIERAIINLRGTVLKVQEEFSVGESEMLTTSAKTLEEMERDYIVRILEDMHWRIDGPRGAARILDVNPSTLRTRMAKLGIQKPNGKGP